ncbi:MAG: hypothetical protein KGL39_47980 [Patescibacteria group bacterium]|nr:hypothetical protein [Patescibacteria group bacterium]
MVLPAFGWMVKGMAESLKENTADLARLWTKVAVLENSQGRDFEKRISRLETLVDIWTEKAAKILHSPHTPELDAVLDKLLTATMEHADWKKLADLCGEIENDSERPKEERALAAALAIVAVERFHLPMPPIHKYTP